MNWNRRVFGKFLSILIISSQLTAAPPAVVDGDVACRITAKAIQKFAACVFPMDFRGTKDIQVAVLGATVKKEIPWEARVSNPVIKLSRDSQTFSADVKAVAGGVPWTGKVDGTLELSYSKKQRAVVVAVKNAIVPVRVGPIAVEIDVAKEIPELPFAIPMPELEFPFRDERILVTTEPSLRFVDNAVVVVTNTTFTKHQ